ncbi:MAG: ribonuclease P protein component [Pseudomonadota bacterium]
MDIDDSQDHCTGEVRLARLRKRRDFLTVAKGVKVVRPSLVLQCGHAIASTDEPEFAHFGFTATKKLGHAPCRNRVRRRLKAAVRDLGPRLSEPGRAYVLIGRYATATIAYDRILEDLTIALKRAHHHTV